MSFESSKNDATPVARLPERITLIDCFHLDAQLRYAARRDQFTDPTRNPRERRGVDRDRLRRVLDSVVRILEETPFDSEDEEE